MDKDELAMKQALRHFATAVRELRRRENVSRETYARIPEVTGTTIANWEHGEAPKFLAFIRLCRAYEIPVPFVDFMPDEEVSPPQPSQLWPDSAVTADGGPPPKSPALVAS